MHTIAALIIIDGYLLGARRWARTRTPLGDAGGVTLEAVIITLGLITVAGLLVFALTTAVQRRVDQIN
ncbi:MAG: hypothetical protein KQH57_20540 [Actinomycetales bacterium]|nr:hypothetical protein [Actinomycetales bacterium]